MKKKKQKVGEISEKLCEIIVLDEFIKDIKKLKKRYRNILNDIDSLVDTLEVNPKYGISLGDKLYKVRLKSSDKLSGKSGGFRVIYYLKIESRVYLVKIYSKNIQENLLKKDILQILQNIDF